MDQNADPSFFRQSIHLDQLDLAQAPDGNLVALGNGLIGFGTGQAVDGGRSGIYIVTGQTSCNSEAERQMLVYLPEYMDEESLYWEDSPVVCLRAVYYEGDSLTHRDFLGALMGAGVARETVGDICVGKGSCDFFVTREIGRAHV